MSRSLRRRPDGTHGNALAFPDGIGDQGRLPPTGRLEAFSDGVFAIAMWHAARTPGIAADDLAEEELQAFARERRAAAQLQAGATAVDVFFPVIATVFYLAVSVLFIVEPLRHLNLRRRRAAQPGPRR